MPRKFFKRFKTAPRPSSDPAENPPIADIQATFHRVHEAAMHELSGYTDEDLQEPLPEPTAVVATKLGSVFFCASHEMLHAGQLGLLRRLLGKAPLRDDA